MRTVVKLPQTADICLGTKQAALSARLATDKMQVRNTALLSQRYILVQIEGFQGDTNSQILGAVFQISLIFCQLISNHAFMVSSGIENSSQ